jgi:hypothetical protein
MKEYPNVNTRTIIKDVPCGPAGSGWEHFRGSMVQDDKVPQGVALLATEIARQLLTMVVIETTAAIHDSEEPSKIKNWTPEQLAVKSCDIATAIYLEFQNRDWFLDAPGPRRYEPIGVK